MKKSLLALAILVVSGTAIAGDVVTDAMQTAYPPYRVALFKTNSNSQAESRQALQEASAAWESLAKQFAAKPLAPYDRDKEFGESVAQVTKVFSTALEQINANKLVEAHETLEKARDVMSEMRRRSQVIVYSDHMNAYHAEMEEVLNNGAQILSQPNGLQKMTAMSGVLGYLSRKLSSEAPAAYLKNNEFVGLLKAVDQSVAELHAALMAQDLTAVKAAMGKIKAPYSKLFLKFG